MKVAVFTVILVALAIQCNGISFPTGVFCKTDRDCPSTKQCKSIAIKFLKIKTCVKKPIPVTTTTVPTTTTPAPQVNCPSLTKAMGVKGFSCTKGTKHNSFCVVQCSSGYCSEGLSMTTCKCNNGVCKWDRGTPKCKQNTNKCEKDVDCKDFNYRCVTGRCGKICLRKLTDPICKVEPITGNPNYCAQQQFCSSSLQCSALQTCCKSMLCNKNICFGGPALTPTCPPHNLPVASPSSYCALQKSCSKSIDCHLGQTCCFSSVCKISMCTTTTPIQPPSCPIDNPYIPNPAVYCSKQKSCKTELDCSVTQSCCHSAACKKTICKNKMPTLQPACPPDIPHIQDPATFCSIQRSCEKPFDCKITETCCPSALCKRSICRISTVNPIGPSIIGKCPAVTDFNQCSVSQRPCISDFACPLNHYCCSSGKCKKNMCHPLPTTTKICPERMAPFNLEQHCSLQKSCSTSSLCSAKETCCFSKLCGKQICQPDLFPAVNQCSKEQDKASSCGSQCLGGVVCQTGKTCCKSSACGKNICI